MKKRFISYLVVMTMIFALLSSFSFTANALDSTTNKYTYIRMAPYWTAEVVDELTSGYSITILEREYTYLYVQYYKDGVYKRGYMPKADTSATGYSWCQHNEYNSGYNSTAYAQTVYYRPGGASCGTIDANEGEVSNKPLLVLHVDDDTNYAFIQYVTNTSNDGSAHVLFKRGWVPTSVITVTNKTYPAGVNQNRYYYIKNVATGKYLDLQSYSAGNVNGGNIHIWDFHGSYNQEWKLLPIISGGSTYVKLATNQGTQNRVIRIAEATAVVGNNVELYTQGNPSKDQEFVFEKVGDYYQIKARCGSNYMVLGVNPGDSGTGGDLYLRYPDGSNYNKWILEVAYVAGEDYHYSELGKISSDIANGINAKYRVNSINNNASGFYGSTIPNVNYSELLNEVFASWNSKVNTNITVGADEASNNIISRSVLNDYIVTDYEHDDTGYLLGVTSEDLGNGKRDITLYYNNIIDYCEGQGYSLEQFESVWKHTLSHEIGHTLSLGHANDRIQESLMAYDRDQSNFLPPANVDIAAVKKSYSTK